MWKPWSSPPSGRGGTIDVMLMAVKFERTAHWRCRVRSLRARQAHLLTKEEKAVGAVLDDLKHSHPRGAASGLGVDVADASMSEALDHSNVGSRPMLSPSTSQSETAERLVAMKLFKSALRRRALACGMQSSRRVRGIPPLSCEWRRLGVSLLTPHQRSTHRRLPIDA